MKRFLIIASLITLTGCFVQAQKYLIQVKPVGSKVWKYANIKGEIVINCEYPESYPFSEEGIAAVYYPKKNLYLFINSDGKEIATEVQNFFLKDIFGYGAKGFSDGLVAIMVDKKWGYMDVSGKIAVPLKYEKLSEFNDGYGVGELDGKFIIIDRTGKETIVNEPGVTDIKAFSENLAPFTSGDNLKGFIDISGKISIPAQFTAVGYFADGLAWAKTTDNLIGFINTKGEWVIKPEYSNVKEFDKESGLARAKKGEEWIYINMKGEPVKFNISEIYDDFHEGLSRGRKNGLYGFFNNKGEWVIEPQFEAARDFKNGYAGVKSNELWGFIDKQGNMVINPAFAGINDVMIAGK